MAPAAKRYRFQGLVDLSSCRYDVVRFVFEKMLGFQIAAFHLSTGPNVPPVDITPGSVVYWSDRSLALQKVQRLQLHRCIANHFPGIELLCRKVAMAKLLLLMQAQFPAAYQFFPVSYTTFAEFQSAQQQQQQQHSGFDKAKSTNPLPPPSQQVSEKSERYFICKPNGGCCGKNITITTRVTEAHFLGSPQLPRSPHVTASSPSSSSPVVLSPLPPDPCIVQEYIDRPLLVHRRKCDLRCYVLITSLSPLQIFFYKEGIVRLCASTYERPSAANARDSSVHLANYSVNKHHKNAARRHHNTSTDGGEEEGGDGIQDATLRSSASLGACDDRSSRNGSQLEAQDHGGESSATELKVSFRGYDRLLLHHIQSTPALLAQVEQQYHLEHGKRATAVPAILLASFAVETLWKEIHLLVVKSILSAYRVLEGATPPSRLSARSRVANGFETYSASSGTTSSSGGGGGSGGSPTSSAFFELLGFDVLVDEDLKPWLIEINHSPSWSTDTVFDFELKRRVIRDALYLSCVPQLRHRDMLRVARQRQVSRDGEEGAEESFASNGSQPKRTKSMTNEDDAASSRTLCDEEYVQQHEDYRMEGNQFLPIFPTPSMVAQLSDILRYVNVS